MDKVVEVQIDAQGVAEVRLNRAHKMNAIDLETMAELRGAAERLQREPRLRAVVLSGNGRAFCAGLDTASFSALGAGQREPVLTDLATRTHGIANAGQWAAWAWTELAVPVIAAVHGVAFGAGLQIALSADIRLVTADLKMSVMEIKWGLVPDMTGIALMTRLARPDVVRELTFTGRVFSGDEAVQLGFATRVCTDPLAAAREMAQQIAACNPDAIRAGKRLLNRAYEASAADILLAESVEQDQLLGSANQIEAVRATLEKRTAQFSS
jgi:enoyl-CoA hydratase/carnithine racemase